MKVIIAGSRNISSLGLVKQAIEESGWIDEITEVVSGCASGVDTLGENWAELNEIPIKKFPADWKNTKVKGAVIRTNQYGKYNAAAGSLRNEEMAKYADALIAIWDGKSRGTGDMILRVHSHKLKVFVFLTKEN